MSYHVLESPEWLVEPNLRRTLWHLPTAVLLHTTEAQGATEHGHVLKILGFSMIFLGFSWISLQIFMDCPYFPHRTRCV